MYTMYGNFSSTKSLAYTDGFSLPCTRLNSNTSASCSSSLLGIIIRFMSPTSESTGTLYFTGSMWFTNWNHNVNVPSFLFHHDVGEAQDMKASEQKTASKRANSRAYFASPPGFVESPDMISLPILMLTVDSDILFTQQQQ